ncbi:hypothetical protein M419DRAFT_64292, partial [Trichoderma reesei RUT C-30]
MGKTVKTSETKAMRAAGDVVAGDLVFGCDAGRRRGTHQIGALCCDEDAGAVNKEKLKAAYKSHALFLYKKE